MSVTMSEISRVVKRNLAVMQKAGILRHEGKDYVGVCVILEKYIKTMIAYWLKDMVAYYKNAARRG